MEFTKQEIETAKKVFETYKINPGCSNSYNEFLYSLLKPETKFINVRIEYADCESHRINAKDLVLLICPTDEYISPTVKITELPEVFTREDMIEFVEYYE